jgi:hypothetical protein
MRTIRSLIPLAGAALFAAAAFWGPPRVTVTRVTGTPPTPGAVLAVHAEHHTDEEKPQLTARALAQRGSERITRTISLTAAAEKGRYGVTKQWEDGTPWVLVFTMKQGENGNHGTAEALVKIDASGKIVGIENAMDRNARGDSFPTAFKDAQVEAALTSLRNGTK